MDAALSAPISVPVSALAQPAATAASGALSAQAAAVTGADTARLHKTAQDFETSFLSVMMGQMFEGLDTSGPFGGGEGEAAFRSFLTDAMAKAMTRAGGIGLTPVIERELIKLQGNKGRPTAKAASAAYRKAAA